MSYRSYHAMCGRKKRFRTEVEARNAARKWRQRIYECPCCGCYHLTSRLGGYDLTS